MALTVILPETVGKTEFRSKDQLKEIEKKMAVTGNQFAGYSLQSCKTEAHVLFVEFKLKIH